MLKKIMKAALAASLVFGFSAMASAEMMAAKVSGDVHTYFGSYNSGAKDYTAWFANSSEAHISVTGGSGPLTGFIQVEPRDDRYGGGNNFNNAQLAVTYTADALSVKLGTVSNGVACTYSISNGLGTTTTAGYGTYVKCGGYLEQDGIQINYAIPAIKGFAGLTIAATSGGQKTALSASGTLADFVGFRFNSSSFVTDDYSVGTDTAATDSILHIGVKVPFGSMSVSLDITNTSNEDKTTEASTAIQFRAANVGPGTVIVTVASDDDQNDGNAVSKDAYTGLAYSIGLDKGASADFFYASKANTPDGGDTTTSSYIGGGLNVAF
jgi:hypothetical protein